MTDRFPRACFAARPILKSILAEILPDVSPSTRLELLAREAGHRSDAAFEACQKRQLEDEALASMLAQTAAAGCLLPLLTVSAAAEAQPATHGRATARPRAPEASEILRLAYAHLDTTTFTGWLDSPLETARSIDAAPARWLFAVAVRDACLPLPEFGDKFWVSKAQSVIVPIMFLSQHFEQDASIDFDLIQRLRGVASDVRDPWTLQSLQLIRFHANTPEVTMGSVLSLVNQALARRRQWWAEPPTYNVGIGPGAI